MGGDACTQCDIGLHTQCEDTSSCPCALASPELHTWRRGPRMHEVFLHENPVPAGAITTTPNDMDKKKDAIDTSKKNLANLNKVSPGIYKFFNTKMGDTIAVPKDNTRTNLIVEPDGNLAPANKKGEPVDLTKVMNAPAANKPPPQG